MLSAITGTHITAIILLPFLVYVFTSVVDPDHVDADTYADPDYKLNLIPIWMEFLFDHHRDADPDPQH